jgi:hypothetical protein
MCGIVALYGNPDERLVREMMDRIAHPEARLRSDEECIYHALLASSYTHPEPLLAHVARWSEQREVDRPRPPARP